MCGQQQWPLERSFWAREAGLGHLHRVIGKFFADSSSGLRTVGGVGQEGLALDPGQLIVGVVETGLRVQRDFWPVVPAGPSDRGEVRKNNGCKQQY